MDKNAFHPESLMMSYGYDPGLSQGAVKCPIFQTSTFVFPTAEAGKAWFEKAYGLREDAAEIEGGLIYSRLNNPNLEILEDRLCLWDGAEAAAVFESGMAAISTVLLEFLKPGDALLFSSPLYGGTDHLIHHFLTEHGIKILGFRPHQTEAEIQDMLEAAGLTENLRMIYVETPANPTNALVDLEMVGRLAERYSSDENRVLVTVDNTYMGPLWSHPIELGADLVLYSATKYIGGHSDVIAGACLGTADLIQRVKTLRTFLGNMASPQTGWLLMRSLETLKVRMEAQAKGAEKVAAYLLQHPKVEKLHYLGALKADDPDYRIFKRQYSSAGAMVSFEVVGGEKEAFQFLNALKLVKLAVSLGSTESLAEHPATMTHADVAPEDKMALGIGPNLVRLSIGIEHPDDLIRDLEQAFRAIADPVLKH